MSLGFIDGNLKVTVIGLEKNQSKLQRKPRVTYNELIILPTSVWLETVHLIYHHQRVLSVQ